MNTTPPVTHCAPFVRRATATPLRPMLASASARCIRPWQPSRLTCTSTSIWRTTSCFHARLPWSRKLREGTMSALPRRIEADPGLPPTPSEIFAVTSARETSLSRLLTVYITTGLIFHAAARHVSGCVEPAGHQQPPRGELRLRRMDPGPRTRANFRVDWNFHPRHWLLFHSQVAPNGSAGFVCRMDHLGAVDVQA